ncbi:MAG: Rieske (2Fe-2S) protein [Ferruginibacter sp.]
MQRRVFIKNGCLACLGISITGSLLQSCAATGLPVVKTAAKNNVLEIPLEKFTANDPFLLVRAEKLENDILLVKKEDHYKALYMQCTHEGVALTVTKNKLVCAAHGSTFDFDGNVLQEPALKPLKEFKTTVQNKSILIQLS